MNQLNAFGLLAVVICAASCRDNDFVYYTPPKPANLIVGTHQLKELLGNNKVDVVWVIDNSGSMSSHQQTVIRSAKDFLDSFMQARGLQWSMAVLSTDKSNRPFLGFSAARLDSTTPNPVPIFQAAVTRLGTSGSGTEQFFDPFVQAVNATPGYLRSNAILAMVAVTDAPDQSDQMPDALDFLDYLARLKGDLSRAILYGALAPQEPSSWGCPLTDNTRWNYDISSYRTVIEATHGKAYKLCTTGFGRDLAAMGEDLVKRVVRPRLYLNERPKAGSIRVQYRGAPVATGTPETGGFWLYDFEMNAVAFTDLSFAPDDDASVEVTYEIDDGLDSR